MRAALFLVCIVVAQTMNAQTTWNLKIDKQGVKVYNRDNTDSRFDEIKAEVTYSATLSELTAAVLDVANHKRWSYGTKWATVIRKISDSEIIFYKEIASPPTVANRDFVGSMAITQDQQTRVVTVKVDRVDGYVKEKEGIVRVPVTTEVWTITPKSPGVIYVDYYLKVDPGGSVAPFLVNMFATKGPFETFKDLKDELALRKKTSVTLSFIID